MTFFEILMSLSVSLTESQNNSSKSAIYLVDKGLYATMRGGRIGPFVILCDIRNLMASNQGCHFQKNLADGYV